MSDERIDLTQFENISSEGWEYLSDESRDMNDAALDKIPDLIAELKRMYEKEDMVIECVGYLLAATENIGLGKDAPSQIHTINDLTGSLEILLDILKDNASE